MSNVDSFDFTSSYPYVMTTYKYPGTPFKKCYIKTKEEMIKNLAYLIRVRFKNIKCKYYNNFISASKCTFLKGVRYDNGRIISATELEIVVTDVDLRFIFDTYNFESYDFLEVYWAVYKYLPKQFINFILDKYILKTKYKNVSGKELEYALEKAKFNSLYGIIVTNTIRDNVLYDNEMGWMENPLSNDDIIKKLNDEKNKGFLSFSYRMLDYSMGEKQSFEVFDSIR